MTHDYLDQNPQNTPVKHNNTHSTRKLPTPPKILSPTLSCHSVKTDSGNSKVIKSFHVTNRNTHRKSKELKRSEEELDARPETPILSIKLKSKISPVYTDQKPENSEKLSSETQDTKIEQENLHSSGDKFENFTQFGENLFLQQPDSIMTPMHGRLQTPGRANKEPKTNFNQSEFNNFRENRNHFDPESNHRPLRNVDGGGFLGPERNLFYCHPEDTLTETHGNGFSWNNSSFGFNNDTTNGFHDSMLDPNNSNFYNQRSSTPLNTSGQNKKFETSNASNAPYRTHAIALPSPRATRKSLTSTNQPVYSYLNSYAFTKPSPKSRITDERDAFYEDKGFAHDGFSYKQPGYNGYNHYPSRVNMHDTNSFYPNRLKTYQVRTFFFL